MFGPFGPLLRRGLLCLKLAGALLLCQLLKGRARAAHRRWFTCNNQLVRGLRCHSPRQAPMRTLDTDPELRNELHNKHKRFMFCSFFANYKELQSNYIVVLM